MKILKPMHYCLVAFLFLSSPVWANEPARPTANAIELSDSRVKELETRLEEINAMDKSGLTRTEKRALRKEVRSIEKELAVSGGVYLSVGAIIIIALLLILLL